MPESAEPLERPKSSRSSGFSLSSKIRFLRSERDKASTPSNITGGPAKLHSQQSPGYENQAGAPGAVPNGDRVVRRQSTHVRTESPLLETRDQDEAVPGQPDDPSHRNDNDIRFTTGQEGHESHDKSPSVSNAEPEKSELGPLRDLWAEAWKSDDVGDERRTLLDGEWEDKEMEKIRKSSKDLVENVVTLTEDKLATYTRRWGTENSESASGKARSILVSALTVQEIVEAGLNLDPTGCGSFAWTVVAFGLKLVQNDKENTDLTFESCDFLSSLMARYARIEALYWRRKIKDAALLEHAIIKVYIAILRYAADVKESSQSHIIHRVKRSIIALTGQPLRTLKDAILSGDRTVEDWQKQIDREEQHKTAEKLEGLQKKAYQIVEDLEGTMASISAVKEIALDGESRELFKWLFNEERAGQNKTHKELRHAIEETEGGDYRAGEWLFGKDEYVEWRKYPQSVLWLFANSGSGKSSLCSTVIQSLEDSFETDDTKVLLYWYFRFYIDETKRIDLLVRSLLRQLGSKCKRFPDDILSWLRLYRDSGKPMKTERLFENLSTFISKVNKDVFIILDGLDEFPENNKLEKRSELLGHITRLASTGHPNLHIILVSKDEIDIRLKLESELKNILVPMDVSEELNKDLDKFVTRKLGSIPLLTTALKQHIYATLVWGEDRSFLYATSLLNEVADCQNTAEIDDAINRVPGSMVAIYEEALKNVKEERATSMKLILIWLMRQRRPLTRNEIAAAAELAEPGLVTQICTKAFVEQRSQNVRNIDDQVEAVEVLRFTHSAARDYLETVLSGTAKSKNPAIARFEFSDDDADLLMTRRCLEILTACSQGHAAGGGAESEAKFELPLLQYAARYWFEHYTSIDRKEISSKDLQALDNDVYLLFKPGNHTFVFWLKTYNPDYSGIHYRVSSRIMRDKVESGEATFPSSIYYAVLLNLPTIALKLIMQNKEMEILNGNGREGTILQLAAHRGHVKVLDALLKRGVVVNSPPGINGTALYAASARGDEKIVQKLLDKGATPIGPTDGQLGNSLHVAAFYGHTSVIKLLLEGGHLQVDHLADPFGTALQAASASVSASASRNLDAIRLLLEYGANPNTIGGCLGTAIQAALIYPKRLDQGSDIVVETLRKAEARYEERYDFWTIAYVRAMSELPMSAFYKIFIEEKSEKTIFAEHSLIHRIAMAAFRNWTLPVILELIETKASLFKSPLYSQIGAILRVAPRLETNIKEVSRKDFWEQALFWSGINHILKHLAPLLRSYSRMTLYHGRSLGQTSGDSALSAFKWLQADPDVTYRIHSPPNFRSRRVQSQPAYIYPVPKLNQGMNIFMDDDMTPMDRNDLVETDLIKYKARLSMETEDDGPTQERTAWILNHLVPLVRDLVHHGDHCTLYHDEAMENMDSISDQTLDTIHDLTFELFSAVIRLSVCIDMDKVGDEILPRAEVKLFRTVKLLSTIRLERIRQLDATCEKLLNHVLLAKIKDQAQGFQETTTEAMRQVQKTVVDEVTDLKAGITRQLGELKPSLTREIESLVSVAVKAEVSQALDKVQDELRSKIRDEVREELLKA